MTPSQSCLSKILSVFHAQRFPYAVLIEAAQQKFRIYRDIRFSPDPTPYKVGLMVSSSMSKPLLTFYVALLLGRMVSCFRKE